MIAFYTIGGGKMSPLSTLTPITLMFDIFTGKKSIIIITCGASLIRRNDIRGFFSAMDLCNYKGIEGIYIDSAVPNIIREIAVDAATCRHLPILEEIPEEFRFKPKAA